MTQDEIRAAFLEETNVTPEIDPEEMAGTGRVREGPGLQTIDVLNRVTALHRRFDVNVPEASFPRRQLWPTPLFALRQGALGPGY